MLDAIFNDSTKNPNLSITMEWLQIALKEFLVRPDNLDDVIKNLEGYRRDWIRDSFVRLKEIVKQPTPTTIEELALHRNNERLK